MTTPPTLDFPDSTCIASVIMALNHVVAVTRSPFTLEEQKFRWPGDQWSMTLQLPPITRREIAAEWQAFGLKLQGMYGNFLMGDPSAKAPRGVATGTPLVNGANQFGNTLITDGWTAGVTGILKKGDYFQLGTGTNSRLYMITEDIDTDGSGNAILEFYPALRQQPPNNAAIIVNDPKGVFRLTSNEWNWTVTPGKVYRFPAIECVEVVNA